MSSGFFFKVLNFLPTLQRKSDHSIEKQIIFNTTQNEAPLLVLRYATPLHGDSRPKVMTGKT